MIFHEIHEFSKEYMNFPNFWALEILEYFTFKEVSGQSAQRCRGEGKMLIDWQIYNLVSIVNEAIVRMYGMLYTMYATYWNVPMKNKAANFRHETIPDIWVYLYRFI